MNRPVADTVHRLALVALAAGPAAQGLAGQIVTDRPTVVESSLVIRERTLQAEGGLALARTDDVDVFSGPLLLRYGMGTGWELRLETPGLQHRTDPDDLLDDTGIGDMALGAKWHVRDVDDIGPSVALLFHADLPTGSGPFGGDGVRPSIRGTAEWPLTPLLTLGTLAGVKFDQLAEERFTSAIVAAVMSQQWASDFATFAELAFTQIASDDFGGNVGVFNLGGLFVAREWLQFDTLLGLPVTDRAPDVQFTVGISYRVTIE